MQSVTPRTKARVAGVFYFIEAATSAFGAIYIVSKYTVPNDAAMTAANLLAHEPLWWFAFACALIAVACHIVYTVLLYELFVPVNKTIAFTALAFGLVAIALQGAASVLQIAPLLVLHGSFAAFNAAQVTTLALLFLKLNTSAFNIYLVFFGFWLALTGYLIYKSTFLPRFLGVLVVLSGFSYLVLLVPPLAQALTPYFLAPDAIGEPLLIIWLLVAGVNSEHWEAKNSLI